jgi:hypothetical protein
MGQQILVQLPNTNIHKNSFVCFMCTEMQGAFNKCSAWMKTHLTSKSLGRYDGYFLGLFFNLENKGSMSLQYIKELLLNHPALHPKR